MHIKLSHLFQICLFSTFFTFKSNQILAQTPYWQQKVDYKIHVSLDDSMHTLKGFEEIIYSNNSPQQLTEIYIHLYANAYSTVNSDFAIQKIEDNDLDFLHSSKEDRGYIDSLHFKIGDKDVSFEYVQQKKDIIRILLPEPLASGKSIKISTPFFVKIPKTFSRMGHEEQAYSITQWYPALAVYDKNGWQYMPYLDQGEFYADYGCFEVSITIPENYVVAATGILQDENEKKYIEQKIAESKKYYEDHSDNAKTMIGSEEALPMETFPASATRMKTIHYKQCDIHDFAWFADKRFFIQKSQVRLPNTKRVVETYAYYTPDGKSIYAWQNAARYVDSTLYYYSSWIGDYKYDVCTAVYGALSAGGGMEYPMITIIAPGAPLEEVIVHEVGHNWFQGMFGTNERKYPWMDEGMNSFYEKKYMNHHAQTKITNIKLNGISMDKLMNKQKDGLSENYLINTMLQRSHLHQPLGLSSEVYKAINYGAGIYMQVPIHVNHLQNYLGEKEYNQAMQDFFQEWSLKHPTPEDMQRTFERSTGKNLSWFFDDLMHTTKTIDYAIKDVKIKEDQIELLIKNKGGIPSPVSITAYSSDSSSKKLWYEGFKKDSVLIFPKGIYDRYEIDADYQSLDMNRSNNFYKTKGAFKKWDGFKLNLFSSKEYPNKTSINFLPALAFNMHDRFMFGAVIHNTTIPYKSKWQYELVPMYAFGSKSLEGLAHARYNWYPGAIFRNIYIDVAAQKFSTNEFKSIQTDYYSVHPQLAFEIKNKKDRSRAVHTFSYTAHYIDYSSISSNGVYDSTTSTYGLKETRDNYLVNEVALKGYCKRKLNPYSYGLHLEQGPEFAKTYAEVKIKINYPKKDKKGVSIRAFGGYMFDYDIYSADLISNSKFSLSGTQSDNDYKYQELYLGRAYFDQGKNSQIYMHDGAFKTHTDLSYFTASRSMVALNLKADLPIGLPFGVFADVANMQNIKEVQKFSDKIHYDAGVYVSLFSEAVEFYMPLLWSDELKLNMKSIQPKWYNRISFQVNLKNFNPIGYARDLRSLNF